MNSRLKKFFNGAVNELRGAYEKSEGAPSACKGDLRESAVRRALGHCLPGMVRLYAGEIIDPFGGHSGQLDGIVVHAAVSALATSAEDCRLVLAEGALSVIESKSDLAGQWHQVKGTWDQIRGLRRFRPGHQGIVLGDANSAECAIPFFVIGRTGWKSHETLAEKASELFRDFGEGRSSPVVVVQLEPPGIGAAFWQADEPMVQGAIYTEEDRGNCLCMMWANLAACAQRCVLTPIDWPGYLTQPLRNAPRRAAVAPYCPAELCPHERRPRRERRGKMGR